MSEARLKGRRLTSEEAALWRRVAKTVQPLDGKPSAAHVGTLTAPSSAPPSSPAQDPSFPRFPSGAAPRTAGAVVAKRPRADAEPADRSGEKRVRRGRLDVVAALDLHGCTQTQARAEVVAFVRRMQGNEPCVVLIVTGKGGRMTAGEASPGVLRQRLPEWLADPALRPVVSGMAPAHTRHGGAGASYVFLRRRPQS